MGIPFTFDEALHICRDMQGTFIPSVSQVMEANNLSVNFRKLVERGIVERDLLDRRSAVGTDVHNLTDFHDEDGEVNPTWITDETAGYLESWIGFKKLSGFIPKQWSIRRCELINGLPLTGESDKEGLLGKHEAIIDLKTGSSKADSWGFQISGYEMLKYRSPKIGRVIRAVAHLQKDGSPGKLVEYGECSKIDGAHYGDSFLAALHNTHVALRRGYLTERDFIEAA